MLDVTKLGFEHGQKVLSKISSYALPKMSPLYACLSSFCQIFQTSHSTRAKLPEIVGTMEGVGLMPQNEDLNTGKKFYQ